MKWAACRCQFQKPRQVLGHGMTVSPLEVKLHRGYDLELLETTSTSSEIGVEDKARWKVAGAAATSGSPMLKDHLALQGSIKVRRSK